MKNTEDWTEPSQHLNEQKKKESSKMEKKVAKNWIERDAEIYFIANWDCENKNWTFTRFYCIFV